MNRFTIRRFLAICTVGALGALSAAAIAQANGATKVNLLKDAFGNCGTGANGGTPTDGFAIIHSDGAGNVIAEVSLKGAQPNHTYTLDLVQTPSGESCFGSEATLTTNIDGNGNVNISEPLLPGTTGAFVLVQPSGPDGFISSTPTVPVG